jgi:AcrR family transcriptional regulator
MSALTMRRLGSELGVEAMALYHHFADRNAILDAVVDSAVQLVQLPPSQGRWTDRLVTIASDIRNVALRHPHLFVLTATRPAKPVAALPMMEAILHALSDGGVPVRDRAAAYHALMVFLRGFIMMELEQRGPSGQSAEGPGCIVALPPIEQLAGFPHTQRMRDRLYGNGDFTSLFESGLDLLIDGFARSAAGKSK